MALDLTRVVPIYQENIDALINQLGKTITLYFEPTKTDCPNCIFDSTTGRSSGRYKEGGPIPFTNGTTCPYCKGVGFISSNSTRDIKGLIKWNPKEFNRYSVNININTNTCRVKTFLSNVADINKAIYAVIQSDTSSILEQKVYLVRQPIPTGLQEDRYALTYWSTDKDG